MMPSNPDPRAWYCDRPDCDGRPHEGMIRCEHTNPEEHEPMCHHARAEQRPPDVWGSVWLVEGERGSGKTKAASMAFASLILDSWDRPGQWAVVGPTRSVAHGVAMESPTSGLLVALGATVDGRELLDRGPFISSYWYRTGTVHLKNGSVVFCDGADDGGYRIQGKNLKGLWADEIGLWKGWKAAWDESIRYAVRISPAKIIATSTLAPGSPSSERLDDLAWDPDGTLRTRLRGAQLSERSSAAR